MKSNLQLYTVQFGSHNLVKMCSMSDHVHLFWESDIILERKKSYELQLLLGGLNAAVTLPRSKDRYSTKVLSLIVNISQVAKFTITGKLYVANQEPSLLPSYLAISSH